MRQFLLATALVLLSSVPADGQEDCAAWGTQSFFSASTAEQVTGCLESGADVDAVGEGGATPLHVASRWTRDPPVIAILVQAGADVNARDSLGRTPLHTAAARNGDTATVVALVTAGADLHARDSDGNTPLHASWSNWNPEVVSTLLRMGADPMARNDEGRPADPANCENMSTEAFSRLADPDDVGRCVEAVADVDARDSDGNTLLYHAVDKSPVSRCTLLRF